LIRIDKFLWHARLVKTRSLAQHLCEAGLVQLRGSPVRRPAETVRPGDEIALSHAGWHRRIRVLAAGARRGPPAEARTLYEEIAPPMRVADLEIRWEGLLIDEMEAG
jgi:ribosome-associated heat shock protein Hsp15